MILTRRKLLGAALALFGSLGMASMPALAAKPNYPTGPVNIVLPFPPGGSTDVVARVIADKLSKKWGQPVTVDNRPGGGGLIGAQAVQRAKPDGSTLLLTLTTMVQTPHLHAKAPYDPRTDFAPITRIGTSNLVLVVHPDVPAKNLVEFVALVKANPGKYSYGSFGMGTSGHLYGHVFSKQQGLDMVHVAYRGEAPSVTDLLGGQVPAVIMSANGSKEHIASGRMRALAVTGASRAEVLPDVPTFEELGYKNMAVLGWYGMFAPAGTPTDILIKVSDDVLEVIAEPEVREKLGAIGVMLGGDGPQAFKEMIARDYDYWGRVIKDAGVKVE